MSLGLAGYGPDVRMWVIGVVLFAVIGVVSPSAALGGPHGGPPSTVFLAERPDLEVEVLAAEGPAVLRPEARRITVEEVEEDNPTPAYFEAVRGRVTANRVVGEIRLWEGPSTVPGKLDARCGTGSPDGEWLKFVAHLIHGPAQPDGHWKGS